MFKSSGILRYSPKLLGESKSKWWLVLDCDPSIGLYYRYWFLKCKYVKIQRAAWAEHISVIRNEEPIDEMKYLWGLDDGKEIEFEYEPICKEGMGFIWLTVDCPFLLDLREKFKLSRTPEYPLHLTIGNTKNVAS